MREHRLFDQFRDFVDKTHTDLHETACIRENAARLEIQLKHTPDSAAAAAVAAVEQAMVAHYVTGSSSGVVSADTLPVVSHKSTVKTLKIIFQRRPQ